VVEDGGDCRSISLPSVRRGDTTKREGTARRIKLDRFAALIDMVVGGTASNNGGLVVG